MMVVSRMSTIAWRAWPDNIFLCGQGNDGGHGVHLILSIFIVFASFCCTSSVVGYIFVHFVFGGRLVPSEKVGAANGAAAAGGGGQARRWPVTWPWRGDEGGASWQRERWLQRAPAAACCACACLRLPAAPAACLPACCCLLLGLDLPRCRFARLELHQVEPEGPQDLSAWFNIASIFCWMLLSTALLLLLLALCAHLRAPHFCALLPCCRDRHAAAADRWCSAARTWGRRTCEGGRTREVHEGREEKKMMILCVSEDDDAVAETCYRASCSSLSFCSVVGRSCWT